jgi:hypothetical protein
LSGAAWITTSATGTGNGSAAYTVAANTGAPRASSIKIESQTLSVTQAAPAAAPAIAPLFQGNVGARGAIGIK